MTFEPGKVCRSVPRLGAGLVGAWVLAGCLGGPSSHTLAEQPTQDHLVNAFGEGTVDVTWSVDDPPRGELRAALDQAIIAAASRQFSESIGAFMTGEVPIYEGMLAAHSTWEMQTFSPVDGDGLQHLVTQPARADLPRARVVARLELDPNPRAPTRLTAVAPAERQYLQIFQRFEVDSPIVSEVGAPRPLDGQGVGYFAPCSACVSRLDVARETVVIDVVDAERASDHAFRTSSQGELTLVPWEALTVRQILDSLLDSYEHSQRLPELEPVGTGRWEREETGSASLIHGDCQYSISFRTRWIVQDGDPAASGFGDIEVTRLVCTPAGAIAS